jgi:hypothetical protein
MTTSMVEPQGPSDNFHGGHQVMVNLDYQFDWIEDTQGTSEAYF